MNCNKTSIPLKSSYMASWKPYPLYDLATWKNGLSFRQIDFSTEGIPVVKIAELKNGVTQQTQFTRTEYSANVRLEYGDMLFSWSGNPETSIDVFWFTMPKGWLNQHIFKVIPSELVDKHYLFYILKSLKPQFTSIATNKQTTGLGHVTVSDLKRLIVDIPDKSTQRAIAATLSCLDDKIELNNRMNKTLEAMAQAIFKSWFVDFEPFQDCEFVDSELGRIPKGWRVGTLGELCLYSPKRIETNILTIYNYYSTENILPNKAGFVPASGIPKNIRTTACCPGDILISNIRPYFKKIVLCTQSGGCSADVLCFTPKEKELSIFLYLLMCSEKFFAHIIAGSKGTKMPRGDKSQIMSYCLAIPPMGIVQAFDQIAIPIIDEVGHNNDSVNKLSITRDALLPRLMSGEIRVS